MRLVQATLCAGVLLVADADPGAGQAAIPREATDDQAIVLKGSDLESLSDTSWIGFPVLEG